MVFKYNIGTELIEIALSKRWKVAAYLNNSGTGVYTLVSITGGFSCQYEKSVVEDQTQFVPVAMPPISSQSVAAPANTSANTSANIWAIQSSTPSPSLSEALKELEETWESFAKSTKKDPSKCDHAWKSYTGLNESFEYCIKCDVKKT